MHAVLPVRPKSVISFQPAFLTAAANDGQVAAARRGKFTDAVAALTLELSGRRREPRRLWRAKK
jgi:hypothetical protein